MKLQFAIGFLVLVFFNSCGSEGEEALPDKPNILWITCEDMTPMLGCYDDPIASTPNLDKLANSGVKYTNAFATAAVCSPARACLITGVFATSLGTQHLRSETEIPEFIKPFPKYLREAGYYCSNNYKEDYNFNSEGIWDESSKTAHWRKRREGQPFFSVFNLETTHQSRIFGSDDEFSLRWEKYSEFVGKTDPESIPLAPYFFDTPEVRKLWARYYDVVSIMDAQVGEILDQLESDGLTENTIVFYYSDHGTGMPRGKRALYESGLNVPLIIKAPQKYRKALGLQSDSETDRLVSFVDFAPTVLNLLGLEVPDYMQGKPFLGRNSSEENKYVHATSDRVDEAFEMSRSVRDRRYRYIRNYYPHLPLIQPNYYSDKSEIMQEIHSILESGPNMTPAQQTVWRSNRDPEELYDVVNDPFELNNLVDDDGSKEVLNEMRRAHQAWVLKTFDSGFMPEPYMYGMTEGKTIYEASRDQEILPLADLLELAEVHADDPQNQVSMADYLDKDHPLMHYWALSNMRYADMPCPSCIIQVIDKLDNYSDLINLTAAEVMTTYTANPKAQEIVLDAMQSDDFRLMLMAARIFELNKENFQQKIDLAKEIHKSICESSEGKWMGYDLYACWSLNQAFKDYSE
jgi:arylsulfatase A-like enzyme